MDDIPPVVWQMFDRILDTFEEEQRLLEEILMGKDFPHCG